MGILYLKQSSQKFSTNCTLTNHQQSNPFMDKEDLGSGWTGVFFSLLIAGCVVMSFSGVSIPTLGGDQVN